MDARQHSLPAGRNREPILGVLKRVVARSSHVLEIASGSGEHAIHFAKNLSEVSWQPSDPDENARTSVAAWIEFENTTNIAAPLEIDVEAAGWERALGGQSYDAIVAINMIHISPWEATLGLLRGAGVVLATAKHGPGILYTYGAYKRSGQHTARLP